MSNNIAAIQRDEILSKRRRNDRLRQDTETNEERQSLDTKDTVPCGVIPIRNFIVEWCA